MTIGRFHLCLVLLICPPGALAESGVTQKIQAGPKPDLVVSVDGLVIKVSDVGTGQAIRRFTLLKTERKLVDLLLKCRSAVHGRPRCGPPFDRAGKHVVALGFGGRAFGDGIKSGYNFIGGTQSQGKNYFEIKSNTEGAVIRFYPPLMDGWHNGTYQLSAVVDSGKALNESNEANNSAGPTTFSIEAPSRAPKRRTAPNKRRPR